MISLFVRSYPKDFEWLSHSVRSMKKNLKGIDDKILCIPNGSQIPDDISEYFNRVVYTTETLPGYLAQQVDKVKAYLHCRHENILFSDSDCIYFQEFDAAKMLDGDKIKLYQTKYSSMSGDVLVWQEITKMATGIDSEYEYMRCFPIMHKAKVCKTLDNLSVYQNYLRIMIPNNLSEFNAIGAIAKLYYPDDYIFLDTEHSLPTQTAKQYWSWGGITPDILRELKCLS